MSFIDKTSVLINTKFGEKSKIYAFSTIKNSEIGNDVTIGDNAIITDSFIQANNSINRRNFVLRSSIGAFTYTGTNTIIRSCSLGKFCSISWDVSIGGGNHDMNKVTTQTKERFFFLLNDPDKTLLNEESKKRVKQLSSCIIGSDVWIATKATIVLGANIGHGAIIGAGAVVTKDVEPYTIVAGVPAKPISKRFPDHIIEALLEIQWWDWPIEVIKDNIDLIYSTKVDEDVIEKMKEIASKIK